jgi:hypothetical protein
MQYVIDSPDKQAPILFVQAKNDPQVPYERFEIGHSNWNIVRMLDLRDSPYLVQTIDDSRILESQAH